MHDFANMAHDCQYFTTLDIKDAYYVIPLRPSDKHKLTIATPLGNFQYNFLPMGLATSSCFYQKLMNEVVSGVSNVFAYLDDIIVKSKDDHMNTLHQLFSRLKMHGLVVNESKCSFCQSSLIFLGHRVSASGISPSETKVRAINEFPLLRTKNNCNAILECINTITNLSNTRPNGCNLCTLLPPLPQITGLSDGQTSLFLLLSKAKPSFLMQRRLLIQIHPRIGQRQWFPRWSNLAAGKKQ